MSDDAMDEFLRMGTSGLFDGADSSEPPPSDAPLPSGAPTSSVAEPPSSLVQSTIDDSGRSWQPPPRDPAPLRSSSESPAPRGRSPRKRSRSDRRPRHHAASRRVPTPPRVPPPPESGSLAVVTLTTPPAPPSPPPRAHASSPGLGSSREPTRTCAQARAPSTVLPRSLVAVRRRRQPAPCALVAFVLLQYRLLRVARRRACPAKMSRPPPNCRFVRLPLLVPRLLTATTTTSMSLSLKTRVTMVKTKAISRTRS